MLVAPAVFIGSSSESLLIAEQVQFALERDMAPYVWNQGLFGLGETTLEGLLRAVNEHDFAVLVFSADDVTFSRQTEFLSPRDNVLFELGLFMGVLGAARTFVLYDRSVKLKLLSDLSGVTKATYDGEWAAQRPEAAIATACAPIRLAIQRHPQPFRRYSTSHWNGKSWSSAEGLGK